MPQLLESIISEHGKVSLPKELFDPLEEVLQETWDNRLFSQGEEPQTEAEQMQRFLYLDHHRSVVHASHYVGVVQSRDVRITVLPKIFGEREGETPQDRIGRASKDILYFLSYTETLHLPSSSLSSFERQPHLDFLEVFIRMFAQCALQTLERHFYRSYETVEENMAYLRGRIDFREHLKQNAFRQRLDRIYCRHTVFQEDVLFNRILKYVARSLLSQAKSDDNRKMLQKILAILRDISDQHCTIHDCSRVVFTRMQQDLVPVLDYCKLFLAHSLVRFNVRNLSVFCFLIDMNVLFEEFIAGFLAKHIHGKYGIATHAQKRDVLTEEKIFQLRYDVLMTRNGLPWLIIDTKYKRTEFSAEDRKGGISQADIYQLVAYAIRSGCPHVLLLYPRFDEQPLQSRLRFKVRDVLTGRIITVHAAQVDLTCLPEHIADCDKHITSQLNDILQSIDFPSEKGVPALA